jgi:hypothetical protein
MERPGAEGQKPEPSAVKFGDVSQRLAGQRRLVQIMFFGEQPVKLGALVLVEQTDVDALQDTGLVGHR